MRTRVLLIAVMPGLAGAFAAADTTMVGSASGGQSFARAICSDCHNVEPGMVSVIGPRTFAEIGSDPKTTETSLRVFLQTSHIEMPNFILTEEQIDDVVAYILNLERLE